MNLFFKSDKLTLPQQVLKNKNDIETLKDKAFIVNPTGAFVENKIYKKYDMVAYQNNAYIYINDVESQNIDPTNTDYWALYSSAQTGLQGPKGATGLKGADGWGFNNATIINLQNETVNIDNNGIGLNQTMHVTAEQQVGSLPPQSAIFDIATQTVLPITGSDTVVVDLAEDGRHANIHLDADITNKLSKTITTPVSAPTSTEIVAVDNTNSQTMLSIGDGLSIENGTLKASGGAGGKLYKHHLSIVLAGSTNNSLQFDIYSYKSDLITKSNLNEFPKGKYNAVFFGTASNIPSTMIVNTVTQLTDTSCFISGNDYSYNINNNNIEVSRTQIDVSCQYYTRFDFTDVVIEII